MSNLKDKIILTISSVAIILSLVTLILVYWKISTQKDIDIVVNTATEHLTQRLQRQNVRLVEMAKLQFLEGGETISTVCNNRWGCVTEYAPLEKSLRSVVNLLLNHLELEIYEEPAKDSKVKFRKLEVKR